MRYLILAMAILLGPALPSQAQAQTQLSIRIGSPDVSLGLVMSSYPTMVRIPGYPVYYDPRANSNYFFYDGLYWVYQGDDWYSSSWYNGPWEMVSPAYVPLFVLRVPVRYYRRPPPYFRGWRYDAAPRWGQHWGHDWERQRHGWDRWNRRAVPRAAPLPTYQRHYSGSHYPHQLDRQRSIESRSYRYQPRDAVSRKILDQRRHRAESRDRQQQQHHQNDRQQQQQERGQRRQDVRQQQQRNARQQRDVQQQRGRRQHDVQQHQHQQIQQRNVQQQRSQQPRSQPAQNARGSDNKGRKGEPDKNKHQKDHNQDGSGHP